MAPFIPALALPERHSTMRLITIDAVVGDGLVEDEELALLIPAPAAPLSTGVVFDLAMMPVTECVFLFRFTRDEICTIALRLDVGARVRLPNGSVLPTTTALCIMLRRLASPARYGDLRKIFGRQKSELSAAFNSMVHLVWNRFGVLLTLTRQLMPQARLRSLAQAVARRGSPLQSCVGFVDGTVRGIARPGQLQREVFNGHKRKHALKFQAIMAADGMFCDVFGPVSGRRHDMYLLNRSNLLQRLDDTMRCDGEIYCIYGDPAYVLRPVLQVGFKGS